MLTGQNEQGVQALCTALQTAEIPFSCDEPLAAHTTFRIGGPAKVWITPVSRVQLIRALALCRECDVRFYLLGRGSNVLFADEGFAGAVIHIGAQLGSIRQEDTRIFAEAGCALSAVCNVAQKAGLSGLEFAYGIPGSVGGAVYMNAGAYGGEMKDVVHRVTFLDERGTLRTLSGDALAFGYRTSVFEHQPWCVFETEFALKQDAPQAIRARMEDYMQRRTDKQPLDMPSAGSTFKRPVGAYAGALIDECGLRGFSVGGAAISTKHCGFVVNTGNATCADVVALTDMVCRTVKEQTGFTLEKEIRVVR